MRKIHRHWNSGGKYSESEISKALYMHGDIRLECLTISTSTRIYNVRYFFANKRVHFCVSDTYRSTIIL
jgi:hypothetical protein